MTVNLLAGWATADITPDKPIELIGQYYQRISEGVRDRLVATALALEQQSDGPTSQSVMVSLDTIFVTRDFQADVRRALPALVPDLDPRMVTLNATHIHSGASWFTPFRWWRPAQDAIPPADIRALMLARVVAAIAEAWKMRRPAGVSSASAFATTGFCRRALYADGTAEMYGDPARPDFVGIESGGDEEVRLLFSWDEHRRLTGIVLNVACPAQVMEAQRVVSADFFGELRTRLRNRLGKCVHLLAQVSAAGDLSPRNLPTQATDETNYWNDGGVVAIARRLEEIIVAQLPAAAKRVRFAPTLRHRVEDITLPIRRVSAAENAAATAEVSRLVRGHAGEATASQTLFAAFVADIARRERAQALGPFDDKGMDFVRLENAQAVVARFAEQDASPTVPVELHIVRIDDCVFASNPFELYVDFGHMIRARSRARRTFVVQLAGDAIGYLPTARAAAAGGYGSLIINGKVGPEGGTALVEATVRAIEALWR